MLKYFTLRRTLNVLKVISSFYISKTLGKPIVWGFPISFSIEPTNHCNLKCPECPSGLGELTRPLGLLKLPEFKKLVDEIKNKSFYIQLFFQGEPYVNKQLPEMIDYAQENNLYISISTNGLLFNEKKIEKVLQSAPDKLIFSLDGLDEESYQNYRVGGTFKKADKSIRLLIRKKKELKLKKPFVELQFIVMKQNEHMIDEVFEYGNDVGVDKVVLKTMQVSSYENALHFLPNNKDYSRYEISNDSYKIKGELKNHCFALWRTSVVTWDGKVVPCCFDKDANFELGKLNGINFREIWKSPDYQNFRSKVLLNRKGVSMCINCTEGLKVNILEIEQ